MVGVFSHRMDSENNVTAVKMIQDEVGDLFTPAEFELRLVLIKLSQLIHIKNC